MPTNPTTANPGGVSNSRGRKPAGFRPRLLRRYRTRTLRIFPRPFVAGTSASYVRTGKASVRCLADAGEDAMKRRARIGELLSRMVPLSGHDVEEILQEQSATRRRFGEIALAWGLCRPEHVWDAWCQQSENGTETVDLDKIGIDSQAAAMLPAALANPTNSPRAASCQSARTTPLTPAGPSVSKPQRGGKSFFWIRPCGAMT